MYDVFTVAFFGHRYVGDVLRIEKLLEEQISRVIEEKEYVRFLVGRNGEFDQCAASSVRRIGKGKENSSLVLVLPYPTAEYLNNQKNFEEYYSEVEISRDASKAHPKSAIQIRNREIVDRADMIICYVEHSSGGAYKTAKYALEQGKTVINLADKKTDSLIKTQ